MPSLIRLLVGGGILAGVVLLAGFAVLGNCHVLATLRSRRLASCTTPTLHFALHVPSSGYGWQLVLGLPQKSLTGKPPPFRGELVIQRGRQEVLRFPVVSWKCKPDNWLEPHGQLQSYFLSQGSTLGDALKSGETYDVTVTFTHPPPSSASVWLAWVD